MMRRIAGTAVLSLVALGALAGCSKSDPTAAQPAGSVEEFCQKSAAADQVNLESATEAEFADTLNGLRDAAPSEIQADVSVLVDAMITMQSDPTQTEAIVADTELEAASQRVNDFLASECIAE